MRYDDLVSILATENEARVADLKARVPPVVYDDLPNAAVSASRAERLMAEAGHGCREIRTGGGARARIWRIDGDEVYVLVHQHGHACMFRRMFEAA